MNTVTFCETVGKYRGILSIRVRLFFPVSISLLIDVVLEFDIFEMRRQSAKKICIWIWLIFIRDLFSILIKQIEVWKVSVDDWLSYSEFLISFFILSEAYYLENGMKNIQFFFHIIILSKWNVVVGWITILEIIQIEIINRNEKRYE
jgi:hypothetical protein